MKRYLPIITVICSISGVNSALATGCALDYTQSYEKCFASCILSGGFLVPLLCA